MNTLRINENNYQPDVMSRPNFVVLIDNQASSYLACKPEKIEIKLSKFSAQFRFFPAVKVVKFPPEKNSQSEEVEIQFKF